MDLIDLMDIDLIVLSPVILTQASNIWEEEEWKFKRENGFLQIGYKQSIGHFLD